MLMTLEHFVEALLHMLKSLEAEAKDFELLLFPADYNQLVELKSEIQVFLHPCSYDRLLISFGYDIMVCFIRVYTQANLAENQCKLIYKSKPVSCDMEIQEGMSTTFPQCNFSPGFPE